MQNQVKATGQMERTMGNEDTLYTNWSSRTLFHEDSLSFSATLDLQFLLVILSNPGLQYLPQPHTACLSLVRASRVPWMGVLEDSSWCLTAIFGLWTFGVGFIGNQWDDIVFKAPGFFDLSLGECSLLSSLISIMLNRSLKMLSFNENHGPFTPTVEEYVLFHILSNLQLDLPMIPLQLPSRNAASYSNSQLFSIMSVVVRYPCIRTQRMKMVKAACSLHFLTWKLLEYRHAIIVP